MSPAEALAQIRALCNESDKWHSGDGNILVSDLRAVLDAVSVDATPAHGIDRDALMRLGSHDAGCEAQYIAEATGWTDCGCADRILALVRPVEGIVLSPEEAELAAPALRYAAVRHSAASGTAWHVLAADLTALASRLEASS